MPKLKVAKIESCQIWKWFWYFLVKVDELNWKLPKLKVAKISILPIERDLYISCHKLTVLMN